MDASLLLADSCSGFWASMQFLVIFSFVLQLNIGISEIANFVPRSNTFDIRNSEFGTASQRPALTCVLFTSGMLLSEE